MKYITIPVLRHFLSALVLVFGATLAGCSAQAQSARPVVAERIDLIRHGESEDNADKGQMVAHLDGSISPSRGKVLSGWNSASLTMMGVAQAVKTGEALRKQELEGAVPLRDALWLYSPLLRTRQTFSGILTGAGLEGVGVRSRPDTRLFERSAGDLTNLTWEEAAQVWPEMKKGRDAAVFKQAAAGYPNGESLEIVYHRAAAAIDDATASERRVIVVSHELTLKALVAYLTRGKIDDDAFKLQVKNVAVLTLLRRDGKWQLAPAQP